MYSSNNNNNNILCISYFIPTVIMKKKYLRKKNLVKIWTLEKLTFTITEHLDFDNTHFVPFLFYYYCNLKKK